MDKKLVIRTMDDPPMNGENQYFVGVSVDGLIVGRWVHFSDGVWNVGDYIGDVNTITFPTVQEAMAHSINLLME